MSKLQIIFWMLILLPSVYGEIIGSEYSVGSITTDIQGGIAVGNVYDATSSLTTNTQEYAQGQLYSANIGINGQSSGQTIGNNNGNANNAGGGTTVFNTFYNIINTPLTEVGNVKVTPLGITIALGILGIFKPEITYLIKGHR